MRRETHERAIAAVVLEVPKKTSFQFLAVRRLSWQGYARPSMLALTTRAAIARGAICGPRGTQVCPAGDNDCTADGNTTFTGSCVEVRAARYETIFMLPRTADLTIPPGRNGRVPDLQSAMPLGRDRHEDSGGIGEEETDAGYILACCTQAGRVEIAG
jgi:hypothetical protein